MVISTPRLFIPLILIYSVVWCQTSSAQTPQSIIVYPTSSSVAFSRTKEGTNASSSCRMGLDRSLPAELLGQEGNMIHVRFKGNPINGCFADWITGRDVNEGWLSKDEITYGSDEPEVLQELSNPQTPKRPEEPCPEEQNLQTENIEDIGALITEIKAQDAGMKSEEEVDAYLGCYPQSSEGHAAYNNDYKPMIDIVTDVFQANLGKGDLAVNKTLFTCLLRRESGFNASAQSGTGAVGLGQHTNINIEHIGNRLRTNNSWESALWKKFFAEASKTPQGQRMLNECPQTKGGREPTFDDKADAACPLNSMAAAAIYNLQVQQALRRSSNLSTVDWKDEMTYQLAIGATYNLGDGAASRAVDDLELDGWVNSIRDRSPNSSKRTEVAGHIEALRNCMQKDNWKPMHLRDQPRCQLPSPKKAPVPYVRPSGL